MACYITCIEVGCLWLDSKEASTHMSHGVLYLVQDCDIILLGPRHFIDILDCVYMIYDISQGTLYDCLKWLQ